MVKTKIIEGKRVLLIKRDTGFKVGGKQINQVVAQSGGFIRVGRTEGEAIKKIKMVL